MCFHFSVQLVVENSKLSQRVHKGLHRQHKLRSGLLIEFFTSILKGFLKAKLHKNPTKACGIEAVLMCIAYQGLLHLESSAYQFFKNKIISIG